MKIFEKKIYGKNCVFCRYFFCVFYFWKKFIFLTFQRTFRLFVLIGEIYVNFWDCFLFQFFVFPFCPRCKWIIISLSATNKRFLLRLPKYSILVQKIFFLCSGFCFIAQSDLSDFSAIGFFIQTAKCKSKYFGFLMWKNMLINHWKMWKTDDFGK